MWGKKLIEPLMHFYGKNEANVCQAKNMCIPIFNMHTNVCDIRKLSNPFN